MVNPENLEYHRNNCHDSQSNEFICPECAKNTEPVHFTGTWGKVGLMISHCSHQWTKNGKILQLIICVAQLHQILAHCDVENTGCPICGF